MNSPKKISFSRFSTTHTFDISHRERNQKREAYHNTKENIHQKRIISSLLYRKTPTFEDYNKYNTILGLLESVWNYTEQIFLQIDKKTISYYYVILPEDNCIIVCANDKAEIFRNIMDPCIDYNARCWLINEIRNEIISRNIE